MMTAACVRPDTIRRKTDPPLFLSASFTVEASLLMPLILLVLTASICLTLYTAARAATSVKACEQAVTGRADDGSPPLWTASLARDMQDDLHSRTVAFRGETPSAFRPFHWRFEAEAVYRKVRPASLIRRILAAKDALEHSARQNE